MVCEHLRQLYQLCVDQQIRLGGSDLIHFVCTQCGRQDVCPSNLRDDQGEEQPPPTRTTGDNRNPERSLSNRS